MKVAILGAGISGLSTACFLEKKGHSAEIFEGADGWGGLCGSETVDGYVADKAGGHIIYSADREVLAFVLGVLGEGGAVESRRETRIFHHGSWVTYPFENGLADLPKEDGFECLKGYVEATFARRNGAAEPTDFHAWCAWRFGEGISRHFMWPYNEKIWNVDLRTLGTAWVRGRVPDAPIDDVLRAAMGIKTTGYAHQAKFWYPRTGGFQRIPDRIQESLTKTNIRLGTPCRKLRRTAAGWEVNGEHFERVVSTIPLRALAAVLDDVPSSGPRRVRRTRLHLAPHRLPRAPPRPHSEALLGLLPASGERSAEPHHVPLELQPRERPAGPELDHGGGDVRRQPARIAGSGHATT